MLTPPNPPQKEVSFLPDLKARGTLGRFSNPQTEGRIETGSRLAILTKSVQFEAAHQLPGHQGKCARLHGHSYRLEVSLRGPIKQAPGESDDGMVMDLQDLSELIQRAVLARLDHRYLNDILTERTTAENLVHWIWDALLENGLPEELLYRLRLWETSTGWVEITREERGLANR